MISAAAAASDGSPTSPDERARKRILIVSNLFPPHVVGGAEIVAHRQARALLRRGHAVAVLAGGMPNGATPGSLTVEDDDGILVYRVVHRSFEPSDNFRWAEAERRLTAIMATWKPDIVHAHNVAGLGMSLIPAAKRTGARVIVTLHDHWGFCFKNTLLRNDDRVCDDPEQCAVCRPRITLPDAVELPIRLRRDYVAWCLDRADLLLSPSRYMADAYARSGVVFRPVAPLSNGIDLSGVPLREREPQDVLRFACFGYLGPHKGIPVLLDAAERLAADAALAGRWSLTIAGHGHLAEQLESDIAKGRFRGAVRYLGRLPRADALDVLAGSDVVVLPSIWPENEPVTLLEAIAAGKAQIATRIGGHADLVDDGQSGLLVPPGSAEDLAGAMARLVREPDQVRRFGAFNRARRHLFDEETTLDRLEQVYASGSGSSLTGDEIVVICAGRIVPDRLHLLLHRFHLVEDKRPRIRFIWHEWACELVWRNAKLVWFWSDDKDPAPDIATRALRAGIPLLVPDISILADLVAGHGVLATYRSLIEAAGLIAAMAEEPDSGARAREAGPASARLLNALQPSASFNLTTETAST